MRSCRVGTFGARAEFGRRAQVSLIVSGTCPTYAHPCTPQCLLQRLVVVCEASHVFPWVCCWALSCSFCFRQRSCITASFGHLCGCSMHMCNVRCFSICERAYVAWSCERKGIVGRVMISKSVCCGLVTKAPIPIGLAYVA